MTPEALDFWQRALQAVQTAEELVDRDPDASSSRAYYAAFYAISALFALEGQDFVKHTAVERAVHRDLVRTGRWPVDAGAAFSWLANLRFTADYGGSDHVQPADARRAVERARLILQTVQTSSNAFTDPGRQGEQPVGIFPGIEADPGVCGGNPCVARTRIPVWLLVQARKLGTTEAELLEAYPGLTNEDLLNAWAYYQAHRDEIERQIQENEAS